MRESDFSEFRNYNRQLKQESWIEIEGFIRIAHSTQGAYLFDHELGQCWIPKRAVKFERKILLNEGEAEYRVLLASWFDWAEKIELMKQGKVISDKVLEERKRAEKALSNPLNNSNRISVMPKIKTPKGQPFINRENENSKYTKSPKDEVDFFFGDTSKQYQKKDALEISPSAPTSPTASPEKISFELIALRENLKLELRTLREDLKLYLKISSDLVMPTRKKIYNLIMKKDDLGMIETTLDKRFLRTANQKGWIDIWEKEKRQKEISKELNANNKRALDL